MKLMRFLGLLGIAIFAFIVYSIGLQQITESILGLDVAIFLPALLALAPVILLKASKQQLILRAFGARLQFSDSAKIWLIGYFFSIISPGRAGDAIKSFYFAEKTRISPAKGLAAVAVERLFDIAVLIAFALIGFAWLSGQFILGIDLVSPMAAMLAFFLIAVLIFSKKKAAAFLLGPFYKSFAPKRFSQVLKTGFDDFFEAIGALGARKGLLLKIALLTVLTWALIIAQYYLSAIALHLDVPFMFLFAVMPIVNLLSILPISFNGIGTREAALIFFFGLIGFTAGTAVSYSLIVFLCNLLPGVAGWLFSQKEKVKI